MLTPLNVAESQMDDGGLYFTYPVCHHRKPAWLMRIAALTSNFRARPVSVIRSVNVNRGQTARRVVRWMLSSGTRRLTRQF